MTEPEKDPLLEALENLPAPAVPTDGTKRMARAAYVESFDGSSPMFRRMRAAVVPTVLASVIVLYLSWAFAAASALVQ